jgi:uncharacterized protein YbjT (DUF2867 family)
MAQIALTGPSSYTSWILARLLLRRGDPVRLLGRSCQPLMPLLNAGAQFIEGNLLAPSKVRALLEDASALYLVTPGSGSPGDPYEIQIAHVVAGAIEASGVEHVVVLSALGADRPGDVPHLQSKAEIEQILLDTGRDVTVLRPGVFMDTLWLARRALDRGLFALPMHPDSALPTVAARDVARAALALLTHPGDGCRAYDLPGPSISTPAGIAGRLSAAWGRVVTYYRYGEAEFLAHLTALGLSQRRAALLAGLLQDYDRYAIGAAPAAWESATRAFDFEGTTVGQFALELVAGHGPPPNLRQAMMHQSAGVAGTAPPNVTGGAGGGGAGGSAGGSSGIAGGIAGAEATHGLDALLERAFGTPEDLPTGPLPLETCGGATLGWLRSSAAWEDRQAPDRRDARTADSAPTPPASTSPSYVNTPRSDEAGSGASGT